MIRGSNIFDGYSFEAIYNRHNHEWNKKEIVDILDIVGFNIEDIRFENNRGNNFWPWLLGKASLIRTNFQDNILVSASVGEQVEKKPIVYRQGLTETRCWEEYKKSQDHLLEIYR